MKLARTFGLTEQEIKYLIIGVYASLIALLLKHYLLKILDPRQE